MALGGGTFLTQNKVVPGSYINFVSAARASAAISDRGIVTVPLMLDWGPDGEVFAVETGDFQKESMKIFGYDYTSDKVKIIRELFLHAKKAYFYRLNSGEKASNTYGTAKYTGTRGNDLKTVISRNVDNDVVFDVTTYLGTARVDVQTVAKADELIRVLDQIANDIAVLFNTRYIGKVQNNEAGRIAFWSDIVTYNKELETLQAIENFSSEDVVVGKGNDKKSVAVSNAVTPVCAMEKLYMTVIVS